jgi:hypothetical protein
MPYPPPKVRGHGAETMRFVCYASLRPDQRSVAGSSLAGPGPREIAGLAIFEGDGGYYEFTCDAEWQVMFDNWCETLEDAKNDDRVDPGQWVNVDARR